MELLAKKLVQNPIPEDEFERIVELSELDLDYSELNDYLKDLNRLAARIAGAPISLVNLIDVHTQWTVAKNGLEIDQMPRTESVCQYTITKENDFEIHDLKADNRFNHNFYVQDEPHLRYYYGIPLRTASGQPIGALCVMDDRPRILDPEKKILLGMVADEVVNRLEFLHEHENLKNQVDELKSVHQKVSHDIRGPIGGIIGLADILKMDLVDNQSEDILEIVSMIKQSGESVLDLADDIMSEADKDKGPDTDEFSAETFSKKLKGLYSSQAEVKDVDLNITTSGDGDSIYFPKSKLMQIAGNVISNSIKYTSKNGHVDVEIMVRRSKGSSDNVLLIFVKDNGVGISREKLDEIMNNETHTSSAGTNGEVGYGFGLSLVKHLVKKAGGEIEIDSEAGTGTITRIILPV